MVALRHQLINRRRLTVDYDPRADVLYLALGQPVADEGEDRPNGIVLRYAVNNDAPSGVTVIGFRRNDWATRLSELASVVSSHLKVDPIEVDRAVNTVIK